VKEATWKEELDRKENTIKSWEERRTNDLRQLKKKYAEDIALLEFNCHQSLYAERENFEVEKRSILSKAADTEETLGAKIAEMSGFCEIKEQLHATLRSQIEVLENQLKTSSDKYLIELDEKVLKQREEISTIKAAATTILEEEREAFATQLSALVEKNQAYVVALQQDHRNGIEMVLMNAETKRLDEISSLANSHNDRKHALEVKHKLASLVLAKKWERKLNAAENMLEQEQRKAAKLTSDKNKLVLDYQQL
jgi:hypothetical protein